MFYIIRDRIKFKAQPITVKLHIEAFERMENLKFLMVDNIHIYQPLKYLPNGLRFLKWPKYPFPLPSKYGFQQLVIMEIPHGRINIFEFRFSLNIYFKVY